MENTLIKIVAANLLVMAAYILLLNVYLRVNGGSDGALGAAIAIAFLVPIHSFFAVAIAGSNHNNPNKEIARGFYISAGLVLLIGFPSCLAGLSMVN